MVALRVVDDRQAFVLFPQRTCACPLSCCPGYLALMLRSLMAELDVAKRDKRCKLYSPVDVPHWHIHQRRNHDLDQPTVRALRQRDLLRRGQLAIVCRLEVVQHGNVHVRGRVEHVGPRVHAVWSGDLHERGGSDVVHGLDDVQCRPVCVAERVGDEQPWLHELRAWDYLSAAPEPVPLHSNQRDVWVRVCCADKLHAVE